jgi:potassium-transporting ATPase KdpC subunit
MFRELIVSLRASLATFVICSVLYPAVVWGMAQLLCPWRSEGSLIYARDRTVIGSALVAQSFVSDHYFHPRPSAVDYKADASGASNLGTTNPDLRQAIANRARALGATPQRPAPVDLVTASGSGLDPHISPEAALYQAPRVATARKLPIEQVRGLIGRKINRSGWILGAPPRVNVLELNLALDNQIGETH